MWPQVQWCVQVCLSVAPGTMVCAGLSQCGPRYNGVCRSVSVWPQVQWCVQVCLSVAPGTMVCAGLSQCGPRYNGLCRSAPEILFPWPGEDRQTVDSARGARLAVSPTFSLPFPPPCTPPPLAPFFLSPFQSARFIADH